MIHTDRAIVVEGKYDKIKLSGMIDGVIVCTGGFRIYKDKEMQAMLRTLANKQGLAVLTDSDAAGFQIRGFIRNICGKEKIVDVYIPDLYGKEKRKQLSLLGGVLLAFTSRACCDSPWFLCGRAARLYPATRQLFEKMSRLPPRWVLNGARRAPAP